MFANLVNKKDFDKKWVDAFLHSMEMDITKNRYETLDETIEYIYGSAEVIGLMMSKIMDLPKESLYYAKYLGRSMQYINFIRDMAEDVKLDRIYFPYKDMREFNLVDLSENEVKSKPVNFKAFLHKQLERYCEWQKKAEEGYQFIPKRYLIPVKTASEMYNWTAEQIAKDPFIIYNLKVKPKIAQIVTTSVLNMVDSKKHNKAKRICPFKKLLNEIKYKQRA
jgi:phytoene synthase